MFPAWWVAENWTSQRAVLRAIGALAKGQFWAPLPPPSTATLVAKPMWTKTLWSHPIVLSERIRESGESHAGLSSTNLYMLEFGSKYCISRELG